MKIVTDGKELLKLIDSIQARGARLTADVQQAGVSSLAHLERTGDIGFCNRLYTALGKGHRRAAMSSWLLAHGSLIANTDGNTKAEKPFVFAKDKATDVKAATEDPWFEHKPEPAPDEVFDVQKALESVLNRAKGKQLAHGELLTKVQEVLTPFMDAVKAEKAATAQAKAAARALKAEEKGPKAGTLAKEVAKAAKVPAPVITDAAAATGLPVAA